MKHHPIRLTLLLFSILGIQDLLAAPKVHGELKQWHKVTIDFTGPKTSETATPNPFTDYRLDVRFKNGKEEFLVPGYYAANGNAGNSGSDSGAIWRVHFAPNKTGEWTYEASFTTGSNVAMGEKGKSAAFFDGENGSFEIAPTDKTGRDFRAHGRLSYVGKHHLQFEGSGEFFLKAGADAPENFLAYDGFDGDFKTDGVKDNLIKNWAPHAKDWKKGDPTWQGGKGKGIIGAVNYLAGQGLNVFSFLTMNIEGDDRNVFPYLTYKERKRLDCSRLDQWEILFEHGTKLGMYLHFKTLEAENTTLLDGGHLGPDRKLYYRELIARFGHHLALNWNLGEEVGLGAKIATKDKQDWASFFEQNDPYHHHLVIHNGNNHFDLLGDASALTGFSLQTNKADFSNVHGATLNYLRRSVKAGKPWVVACDEPGDASHSLIPDAEDPTRNNARRNALWGNIMAGGAGVEWYFGYKHAHSDLSCQDYRVREKMWKQSSIALQFFADHKIPFWNMSNANNLLSGADGYCLREPGKIHLAFLKQARPSALDLSGAKGIYTVHWFNPRDGGGLQTGTIKAVQSGGHAPLGNPPGDSKTDWLVILKPADVDAKYPGAAKNIEAFKAKSNPNVLSAIKDFKFVSGKGFVLGYLDNQRKAMAINAAAHKDKFAAAESKYRGKPGKFNITLTTLTETDGDSTYRLLVNGRKIGQKKNPATKKDYKPAKHVFKEVTLKTGDTLRVEFNTASNGKIPEGDTFAFARGRWQSLTIGNGSFAPPSAEDLAPPIPAFEYNYDQSKAKKIHKQTNGIVVVEAEDFDHVDRQFHRKWLLTTKDKTPGVKPDPDPNHAEGALGRGYLELLPDTRRTHSDPLVKDVSFTNTPGRCSVLYYPVEFADPGRYYVWVRMNCTGSEDNGIHVGLDGKWPKSGARMQFTGKHGEWQWDSRQRTEKVHTGVLGQIWLDVEKPGRHTIMFSMREDGFEFDRFLLTKKEKALKSKNPEPGPPASPKL